MNLFFEMIGSAKRAAWAKARKNIPLGEILPKWLLVVRAILFPLDTLFFTLGKGRGYQFERDVWVIEGIVVAGAALLQICRPGESRMIIVRKNADGDIFFSRPTYNFMTGSNETEDQLRRFAHYAGENLNIGVPRCVFVNADSWKTMTVGRNGPTDPCPGSECFNDTGGFFVVGDDGLVYLTEKAKGCARLW